MVPKSDHLANTRFDKKPSAQADYAIRLLGLLADMEWLPQGA